MDRDPAPSIRAQDNGPNGRPKRVVEGRSRRYGEVVRRPTRRFKQSEAASPATRMDGNMSGYSNHCQGSRANSETPHFAFNMNEQMPSLEQCYMSPYPQHAQQVPFEQFDQQHSGQHVPLHADRAHDDDVQEVDATQMAQIEEKRKGLARRGKAYDPEEDKVLCSAWLNVSLDATTGTNQDKMSFYKRIHMYFLQNYDMNSKRTPNSLQQRWSTINKCVSKFCCILGRIERMKQSGKNFQDMVNDAIKEYQDKEKEPWHFGHCWEVLRDEPKWNNRMLELNKPNSGKGKMPVGAEDEVNQSAQEVSSMPQRPEGRDSAKRKKAKLVDTSSSSVAVDMLQKMHVRGQHMDEIDNKHKEDLISLEKAKFDLQQKQWQAKFDMILESNRLQRELTERVTYEQLKAQREMTQAQIKVQLDMVEMERQKADTQIMFTDVSKLNYPLREWVQKKQLEILAREGIDSGNGSEVTKEN